MMDSDALKILIALGDQGRFEIFRKVCGQSGLTASELSAGKAASTNSHHLAKLEQAGVLQATRAGKTKCYAVDQTTLQALAAWVTSCAEDAIYAELDRVLLSNGDKG